MSNTARPNAVALAAIIILAGALVVFITLFAVERSKHSTSAIAAQSRALFPLAPDQIILRYQGGAVRVRDLDSDITAEVSEAATDRYKKSAQKVLLQRLLTAEAKKQDKPSVEALLDPIGSTTPVTEDDVTAFMKKNDLEHGFKDPDTGKVRPVSRAEIREHLIAKNQLLDRQDYVEKLIASAGIQWTIDQLQHPLPPIGPDEPVLGSRQAKVVLFAYSDFQCPYCAEEDKVLHQVHQTYGDKVAIVFRQLPLEIHPEARAAAIASICAQEQGKFWQFHDLLFQHQDDLSETNFRKWSRDLGLDQPKFQACVADANTSKMLESSVKSSTQVGVDSVPTFFVATSETEREMHGTRSFDDFKELIDAGLR